MTRSSMLTSAAVVCAASAWAHADPVLTFDLAELAASYDSRTQALIIQSVNFDPLASTGVIERVASPGGVATFSPPGEVSNDQWNFVLFSSVVLDGPTTATGFGFFTATDHNGDSFRAEFQSSFSFNAPGLIDMHASIRNFQFASIVDGTFEGSDGNGWSMDLGATSAMGGSLHTQLFGGSTFFSGPFGGRDAHLTGTIVPAPLALATSGIGAAIFVRRRRRP